MQTDLEELAKLATISRHLNSLVGDFTLVSKENKNKVSAAASRLNKLFIEKSVAFDDLLKEGKLNRDSNLDMSDRNITVSNSAGLAVVVKPKDENGAAPIVVKGEGGSPPAAVNIDKPVAAKKASSKKKKKATKKAPAKKSSPKKAASKKTESKKKVPSNPGDDWELRLAAAKASVAGRSKKKA